MYIVLYVPVTIGRPLLCKRVSQKMLILGVSMSAEKPLAAGALSSYRKSNSLGHLFIPCNTKQYRTIPWCHTIPWNTMRHHAILHNIIQYLSILCNSLQYHTIPFQFYAIVCNTTQYQVQLQKAQFTRSSVCRSTEWIVRLFRRSKYRWMGKTKKNGAEICFWKLCLL